MSQYPVYDAILESEKKNNGRCTFRQLKELLPGKNNDEIIKEAFRLEKLGYIRIDNSDFLDKPEESPARFWIEVYDIH